MSDREVSAAGCRFRGLTILAAFGLLGWGLSALDAPPRFAMASFEGEGPGIIIIVEVPSRSSGAEPETLLVLARTPMEIDARRRVLTLPGGAARILPRSWSTVTVEEDGWIEPYPLLLRAVEATALLGAKGHAEAASRLLGIDPGLKDLLE